MYNHHNSQVDGMWNRILNYIMNQQLDSLVQMKLDSFFTVHNNIWCFIENECNSLNV